METLIFEYTVYVFIDNNHMGYLIFRHRKNEIDIYKHIINGAFFECIR